MSGDPGFQLPRLGAPPADIKVTNVSGDELTVLGQGEATWYERSRNVYLEQTKFTEVTDRNDLDRLLFLELMVHRWGNFLAAGKDYQGADIDEALIRRNMRDYSDQINKVKEAMGLSRRQRDATANAGDFSAWHEETKRRARVFGIHREGELQVALTWVNDFMAKVGAYDRSDEEERGKLGFPDEHSLLEWCRKEFFPAFRAVDEHFRENEQKYWTKG